MLLKQQKTYVVQSKISQKYGNVPILGKLVVGSDFRPGDPSGTYYHHWLENT